MSTSEKPPNFWALGIVAGIVSAILFVFWGWQVYHEGIVGHRNPIIAGFFLAISAAGFMMARRSPEEQVEFWQRQEAEHARMAAERAKRMKDNNYIG